MLNCSTYSTVLNIIILIFDILLWLICTENKYVNSDKTHAWWLNIRIKIKLCRIYKAKGMIEGFVDMLLPLVCESSYQEETFNHEEHRLLIIDVFTFPFL